MDLKVYERTRYQNIYRHKKNKNYVVSISKPAKTSISSIDGRKMFTLDEALKVRDNPKIKMQKGNEAKNKEDFDLVWEKYMFACKNILKLGYSTLLKKEKLYNKYLSNKFKKKLSKILKEEISQFIDDMDTTDKQKNEMIKTLKAFFNWCVNEEYLIVSPMNKIQSYKVEKPQMKFWIPDEIKKILDVLENDINSTNFNDIRRARLVKIFILIGFSLGDRVGETRALTFDCFDKDLGIVKIKHSINYDPKSNDFLSHTKNYHSQRNIDVTDKLIDEVNSYKKFLMNYTDYNVKDGDIIFFNYSTNRPYSDNTLRKKFTYYCDKAGITKIRMYDLRHTYVTTMMSEGKELYHISSRLGHSNYSTTVNKYGHLSNKTRKEIAAVTDKYI